MSTIAALATEYNSQPYEVAALLGLDTGYSVDAELDATTEADYRDVLDYNKAIMESEQA